MPFPCPFRDLSMTLPCPSSGTAPTCRRAPTTSAARYTISPATHVSWDLTEHTTCPLHANVPHRAHDLPTPCECASPSTRPAHCMRMRLTEHTTCPLHANVLCLPPPRVRCTCLPGTSPSTTESSCPISTYASQMTRLPGSAATPPHPLPHPHPHPYWRPAPVAPQARRPTPCTPPLLSLPSTRFTPNEVTLPLTQARLLSLLRLQRDGQAKR